MIHLPTFVSLSANHEWISTNMPCGKQLPYMRYTDSWMVTTRSEKARRTERIKFIGPSSPPRHSHTKDKHRPIFSNSCSLHQLFPQSTHANLVASYLWCRYVLNPDGMCDLTHSSSDRESIELPHPSASILNTLCSIPSATNIAFQINSISLNLLIELNQTMLDLLYPSPSIEHIFRSSSSKPVELLRGIKHVSQHVGTCLRTPLASVSETQCFLSPYIIKWCLFRRGCQRMNHQQQTLVISISNTAMNNGSTSNNRILHGQLQNGPLNGRTNPSMRPSHRSVSFRFDVFVDLQT